ncbi:MAG: hypothetical protein CMO65_01760 [Verrucomicrobiales bacterium]|nr:hypothetical protein [Verrucomicrobiales bacterium]
MTTYLPHSLPRKGNETPPYKLKQMRKMHKKLLKIAQVLPNQMLQDLEIRLALYNKPLPAKHSVPTNTWPT